jgi:hypothetical protein
MLGHELYAVPPEGFIEARNRMVTDLREAGDDEGAAAVKALRRPTVAAYAVDLGARQHPELVERLLDVGQRLAAAQRQVLSGRAGAADELRAATDDRRRVLRELADACLAAMEADGRRTETLRDPVTLTLEAASIDDELGARLREGTIEREAAPTAGLGGAEGFAVVPGGRQPDAEAADTPGPASIRETEREAREAAKTADAAERAAAKAQEKAERLRAAVDDAETAARGARDDARRLADEARTARRRADRAARAVEADRKGRS